jgi:hypothetical protein
LAQNGLFAFVELQTYCQRARPKDDAGNQCPSWSSHAGSLHTGRIDGGLRFMWEDPIVKEVRQARLEIEQECGGDFRKIYERALEIQKKAATEKQVSDKKAQNKRVPLVA